MNRRTLAPLLALLACLVLAAPASAALTGNFSGKTTQDLKLTEEPYESGIVFSILRGRIVNVVAEVRMECPGPSVYDAKVLKSYRNGTGPRLVKGSFGFKVQGVHISGGIGKRGGSGSISSNKSGCHGNGEWSVKYVPGT